MSAGDHPLAIASMAIIDGRLRLLRKRQGGQRHES